MDDAGYDALVERLISRLPDDPMYPRYMVSLPRGWADLVDELDRTLAEAKPNYELGQVKEKFGGLRFYTNEVGDDWFREVGYGLIRDAEAKSFEICDECGEPGKLREGGWVRTLCDKHAAKREKQRVG